MTVVGPDRSLGAVDPFTFEIVRHKLFRITEEAEIALVNASGTSITAEGHDLMVSLYRADGSLMVGGAGFIQHITSASQAVKHIITTYSTDPGLQPDDVFLFNDPYTGALHAPDIYLIAPLFFTGKLAGFVAGFVHVSDIGGIDPGGFCPRARSSFEEGFSTRGLKLVEGGRLRTDVFDTILNVVRDPGIVALDIKSLLAAVYVAKDRMSALYGRYGLATVDDVCAALVVQSESLFRRRLLELPEGAWRSRTYLEGEEVRRIELVVIKARDTLLFDFTGTGREAETGVNCSYWATWGSIFASLFVLVVPDLVWNDGIIAPVTMVAPEGSLVNARRPAPVSLATIAMVQSVRNVSIAALSKMLGASNDFAGRATGTWAPTNVRFNVTRRDENGVIVTEHGTDQYAGSGGALSTRDGLDVGGQIHALGSRCANVEQHESRFPYRYLYRRIVPDSGGPGKYRGGMCHEYAVTPHGSAGSLAAALMPGRGMEAPLSIGLFGGYPGCNTAAIVFRHANAHELPRDLSSTRGEQEDHIRLGLVDLGPDDILYIRHEGAAGYGDPLDRAPTLVARDVAMGLVSKEAAADVYGVVLAGGETATGGKTAAGGETAAVGEGGENVHGRADEARPEDPAVDADGTDARRREIRRSRLGGGDPAAPRPQARTRFRIGEYLQLDEQGSAIQCTWCGETVAPRDARWKDHAVIRESTPSVAGPWRAEGGRFRLLEFFCPGCATALDVEVVYGEDGPLHDTIERWPDPSPAASAGSPV